MKRSLHPLYPTKESAEKSQLRSLSFTELFLQWHRHMAVMPSGSDEELKEHYRKRSLMEAEINIRVDGGQ